MPNAFSGARAFFIVTFEFDDARGSITGAVVSDPLDIILDGNPIFVDDGETFTFIVEANPGYHIESISVDGAQLYLGVPFNTKNSPATFSYSFQVDDNIDIHVVFEENIIYYSVTITIEGQGEIKVDGGNVNVTAGDDINVEQGEDLILTILPGNGYLISQISVGSVPIDLDADPNYEDHGTYWTFTLENVTSDNSIHVIFEERSAGVGIECDFFEFTREGYRYHYTDDDGVRVFVFDAGTTVFFTPHEDFSRIELNDNNIRGASIPISVTTDIVSIQVTRVGANLTTQGIEVPLIGPIRIHIVDPTEAPSITSSGIFWGSEHQEAIVSVKVTDHFSGVDSVIYSRDPNDFGTSQGNNASSDCENIHIRRYRFELNTTPPFYCRTETVYVWAYNSEGIRSELHEVEIKIDTREPIITGFYVETSGIVIRDFGTFYDNSINVRVYAKDPIPPIPSGNLLRSGLREFTLYLDGIPIETKPVSQNGESATFTIYLPENSSIRGALSATVTDNAGNVSDVASPADLGVTSNVDSDMLVLNNLPPEIEITPPPAVHLDPTGNKWYNSADLDIIVTVQATNSSIYHVEIKINGNSILTDINGKAINVDFSDNGITDEVIFVINTSQGTIGSDGEFLIEVIVYDIAGVGSEWGDKVYIDTDIPYITGFSFVPYGNRDSDPNDVSVEISAYGFYFKEDTLVTIYAADDKGPSAGIRSITYETRDMLGRIIDRVTIPIPETDDSNSVSFIVEADFKGHIFAGVTDNVRNTTDSDDFVSPYGIIIESPSMHNQEQHIFFSKPATPFVDTDGLALYSGDVSVQVRVVDTFSGLRNVRWSVVSPTDIGNNQNGEFSLNNTGHSVGQTVSGWNISQMDKNLVTEMTNTIVVSNNSNAIRLWVEITDRAGNISEETIMFSIDTTNPEIDVIFDNNNPDRVFTNYFNADRTATIIITERNFRAQDVNISISNAMPGGSVPAVSSWTSTTNAANPDLSRHTATITFSADGDYSFTINYSDKANNPAQTFTQSTFTIDQTIPEIFVTYDNNSAQNINFFNAERTATITITERNFFEGRVDIVGTATLGGNPVEFPQLSDWTSVGNVHTATLHFSEDAYYNFSVAFMDMAGNIAEPYTADSFHIVKTMPELRSDSPARRNLISVYREAIDIEPSKIIEFYELNLSHIVYTIIGYNYTEDGENNGIAIFELIVTDGGAGQVNEHSITLPLDMFRDDGVYELRATAFDLAGNASEEVVHTYVVMRNVDMMAYIHIDDLAAFNGIGKQAINVPDIPITIYTIENASFSISIGGVVLAGGDYDESTEKIANGVTRHKVTVPSSFIARTFNEDDQIYHLPINVNKNPIRTVGHLVINNVTPSGIFGSNLRSGKGYYGVSEQLVHVINLSDGIDINTTTVNVNGHNVDFVYNAADGTIAFVLERSPSFGHPWAGHQIRVTLIDTAGNEFAMEEVNNVFVGNWFMRYWILLTLAGVVVVGAASLLIFQHKKRKKIAEG